MTADGWLDGLPPGEAVELLRTTDWAATELGPVSDWSPGLRTAVGLVLSSRFPLLLAWGPDLVQLYNDAMIPLVGDKHPQFGWRIRDTWAEIWDVVGPMLQGVLDSGVPTWSEDQLLLINKHGFAEDLYITFSYSPLADENGRPVAVLATTIETTDRVLDARRMRVLHAVSTLAASADDPDALLRDVVAELRDHAADLRFVTAHVDAGDGLALVASTHGVDALDLPVDGRDEGALWALPPGVRPGLRSMPLREPVLVPTDLPEPMQVAVQDVVLLPFAAGDGRTGLLSVGRSPTRSWDAKYQDFLVLLAQQLGTAMTSAAARASERRRIEELAALDRAKADFLGDVSHELRTPLTLVAGPLAQVLAGGRLDPADRRDLETARRAADRLGRLVDSLLTHTRAEAGSLPAHLQPVDLGSHASQVTALFADAARRAGLSLVVDAEPLPDAVLVDPDHLETIVVNLVSNALKFTRAGEVRVVVRAAPTGGVLEVHDTGCGIADAEQQEVFDRFRRGRSDAARSVEGIGIGLSLVRKLVDLQGGRLELRSGVSRGSVFRVELPWAQQAATSVLEPGPLARSAAAEAASWAAPAASASLVQALLPRVVLAEDNADMRAYVSEVLAPHVRVEAVVDGARALDALRREPADLLLTDVRMPSLDGRALLDAVRADSRLATLPVVLLSAHADGEAVAEAVTAGADDYLVKPFTPAQLVARVVSTIELARRRVEAGALHAHSRGH